MLAAVLSLVVVSIIINVAFLGAVMIVRDRADRRDHQAARAEQHVWAVRERHLVLVRRPTILD